MTSRLNRFESNDTDAPLRVVCLQQAQVSLPLVAYHLRTQMPRGESEQCSINIFSYNLQSKGDFRPKARSSLSENPNPRDALLLAVGTLRYATHLATSKASNRNDHPAQMLSAVETSTVYLIYDSVNANDNKTCPQFNL